MKTGLIYDELFLRHDTGQGHPECAERLSYTINTLVQQSWFASLNIYTSTTTDISHIALIHNLQQIEKIKKACIEKQAYIDSMDVSICEQSYNIALHAVGSVLSLADNIMNQNLDNAFALIRPPGHHAEKEQALGFCLFNNVAILARYLQTQFQLDKILIIDWDVHHGNGTQHIFEEDPSILYISTHQYPYYPGTGAYSEEGIGRGKGATLNCPMNAGDGDLQYESAFIEKILPKIDSFKPEFIIISAGFDAHTQDPLGQINLSTEFYAWMTERIIEKAEKYCEGRILSVLEGGYHLEMLARCVTKHLEVLSNNQNWSNYP